MASVNSQDLVTGQLATTAKQRAYSGAVLAAGMFLMGGIGLAYEYTFSKLSSDLLGNSTRQWAIVIAVMMLFMGIGADVQKYFRGKNLVDALIVSGAFAIRVLA